MTDITTLKALLAEAEGLEGPSREVDEAVHWQFGDWPELADVNDRYDAVWGWRKTSPGTIARPADSEARSYESKRAPEYTASLDAAIELFEATLPEWTGFVGVRADTETWIWKDDGWFKGVRLGNKKTPALALLAAILKAKIVILEAEQEAA